MGRKKNPERGLAPRISFSSVRLGLITALAFLALFAPHAAPAQSSSPAHVSASPLHFQISTPQSTYHVGEVIRVELTFTSDVDHAFRILTGSPDIADPGVDNLALSPSDLAVPYDANTARLIRTEPSGPNPDLWTPLGPAGAQYSIVLNSRYVLKKSGSLQLRIVSRRVSADLGASNAASTGNDDTPPFPLTSNTLSITIVPATPEWQATELAQIKAQIDSHPPHADGTPSPERQQAIERLIYLSSPDAVRELVHRFVSSPANETMQFATGMALSDYHSVAIEAANKLADDPSFGITPEFESLLAFLPMFSNMGASDRESEYASALAAVEPQLWAVLNTKQGKAFETTLETAEKVKAQDPSAAGNAAIKQAVPKLIEMFRELPPDKQSDWLAAYWNDVKDPAWITVVRAIATDPASRAVIAPGAESSGAFAKSVALEDWAELDPEGARETILSAMMSGDLEFGSNALSALPDKTLPDAQQRQLARLFLTATDSDTQQHFAEMLERYGGEAAWNDVSTAALQSIRTYPCRTQINMLYFAARVSPDAESALFEAAMVPPDNGAPECRVEIFASSGPGDNNAVPEKYVIAALDDPNIRVVQSAARYLESYGTAQAEAALWRRYEIWAAAAVTPSVTKRDQVVAALESLQVGVSIARALEHGPGWLADREKLERLNALAGNSTSSPMVDEGTLAQWMHSPVVVSCNKVGDNENQFTVAQYVASNVDELKARLALFPSGTTLEWDAHSCTSEPAYTAMFNDLASSLSLKGVTLAPADAVPAAPAPPETTNESNGGDAPSSSNGPSPDAGNIVPDRVVVVN